jgi:hypothetical protein
MSRSLVRSDGRCAERATHGPSSPSPGSYRRFAYPGTRATFCTRAIAEAPCSRSFFRHSPADRSHQIVQLNRLDQVVGRVEVCSQRS